MNDSALLFDKSFPILLKQEAENVLGSEVSIGEKFKSADSFSYLIKSGEAKYVGKIYRFKDWPPKGKLQIVEKLLNANSIPHEEIIYTAYGHNKFVFGWSISKYIPGGSARNLRNNRKLSGEEYFAGIGRLLEKVHKIKLESFGSLHDSNRQFKTFNEYIRKEIEEENFEDLLEKYPRYYETITTAKNWVLKEMKKFGWKQAVLVHDDASDENVIWNNNNPVLIDWVDSLAAPPVRDFAVLTFRQDRPVLELIENEYRQKINQNELKLHQVMRLIRLSYFYYFEDKNLKDLEIMIGRLKLLLNQSRPLGVKMK